jgi:hypothetical protein
MIDDTLDAAHFSAAGFHSKSSHCGTRRSNNRNASCESPVARRAKLIPSAYQDRKSVVNSKVMRTNGAGANWARWAMSLYIGSDCCRLQQTTGVKNGAHATQSSQLPEFNSLIVGSWPIPHGAHGCPYIKAGVDSGWTPQARFLAVG